MTSAPTPPAPSDKYRRNLLLLGELEASARTELGQLPPLYEAARTPTDWQLASVAWDLGLDAAQVATEEASTD
jgi:hypothetical protein